MADVSYEFDPTGIASANLVNGETHTISELNDVTYNILIPKFAPFYLDNFAIYHVSEQGSLTKLNENEDFTFALYYIGASRSIGKNVYGGIVINSKPETGTFAITYQTIGGEWTADPQWVLDRLAELVYNPKTTVWDVVTNKPNQFPPINHSLDYDNTKGQDALIDAINALSTKVAQNIDADALLLHEVDAQNPHRVTAHQTGTYTAEEILNLLNTLNATLSSALQAHIGDYNNPHQTTAHQVDAYTQAEIDSIVNTLALKDPAPTVTNTYNDWNVVIANCDGASPVVTPIETGDRLYMTGRKLGLEHYTNNCQTNNECSLDECKECVYTSQCEECTECSQCTQCETPIQCTQCLQCNECTECIECNANTLRECNECDWIHENCVQCAQCYTSLTQVQCNTKYSQCTISQCTLIQCSGTIYPECTQCAECYECGECIECRECHECN